MLKMEIKLPNRTIYVKKDEENNLLTDYYDPVIDRIYLNDIPDTKENIKQQIKEEINKLKKSIEELEKF